MSQMNCLELEELLADYVDGVLAAESRIALEAHAHSCPSCAQFVADVTGSVQFLGRVAEVEPPRELITRILYHTPKPAPLLEKLSPQSWLRRWLSPFLQPRFAMGMAMTILSFSMLGKFVAPTRQLKASDLDPVRVVRNIDESIHRAWDNAVKYYDNLRLVYEIQSAIDDIKGPGDDQNDGKKKGDPK
jgi:hypothetical protein